MAEPFLEPLSAIAASLRTAAGIAHSALADGMAGYDPDYAHDKHESWRKCQRPLCARLRSDIEHVEAWAKRVAAMQGDHLRPLPPIALREDTDHE